MSRSCSFLVGAAVGAGITALGVYLWPSPRADALLLVRAQPTVAADHPAWSKTGSDQTAAVGTAAVSTLAPLKPEMSPAPDAADRTPAAAPPQTAAPILLSAEHAKVLMPSTRDKRPPTLAELHIQLLGEPKDPTWSFETEQAIRQAIAAGNASAEFDVPTVECRESICEVLAFGNLPESGGNWNQMWDAMAKQPWYGDFKGNTTSSFVQNGRYTIVTIVQRPHR